MVTNRRKQKPHH